MENDLKNTTNFEGTTKMKRRIVCLHKLRGEEGTSSRQLNRTFGVFFELSEVLNLIPIVGVN